MIKTTQLNNGDIADHDAIQQAGISIDGEHPCGCIWESGLVDTAMTLENVEQCEKVLDEMSLRFEKSFT